MRRQQVWDFAFFPLRAIALFEEDKWGLSSLATERMRYVASEVDGYCLDVGCGRHNRLIKRFLNGNGVGVDVYPYEGLDEHNIVTDLTKFPFADASFDTITFVANVNHIPRSQRLTEFSEAHRCLRKGGKIVVTMGNPVAEVLVHKLVAFYDRVFNTSFDVDGERGMQEEEDYYLSDREITRLLKMAGFVHIDKKYFPTQWGLNHLFTARKT